VTPTPQQCREEAVEAILRERESRYIYPPERGSEDWSCWVAEAEEDFEAAAPLIRKQAEEEERERLLGGLRERGAISADLEEMTRRSERQRIRDALEGLQTFGLCADPEHPGFSEIGEVVDGAFLRRDQLLNCLEDNQ